MLTAPCEINQQNVNNSIFNYWNSIFGEKPIPLIVLYEAFERTFGDI